MFEKAARLKLRFDTPRGNLTVEDLWDIPLTGQQISLDNVAKAVNKGLKASEEESFVAKPSSKDRVLSLKLDILKHVIRVRLAEA